MNKYAVVDKGVVINVVVWDGVAEWRPEVGGAILISDGAAGIGWMYDGTQFSPQPAPEKTHDELILDAEQKRASLLNEADAITSDWRTELALGIIDDDDKASLTAWMKYIKAIKAVDTSNAPAISWPPSPE